jgi:23S rRNA pseudouridine1911/1915/1917 synthase
MRPENIPLEIIYEDNEIIVVNKPTDMLVHPTHRDKDGTLLNALAYHLNREMLPDGHEVTGEIRQGQNGALSEIKYPRSKIVRPGLVHRLDRQTSGLMVIAKSVRVHRILADHFKKKLVKKLYTARVEGAINEDEGIIDAPIGRYAEMKLWNVKDDGKHSRTRFWVRRRGADSTILELEPVTGRTNQLRIHCSWIGHPIVGDVNRGGRPFRRLCLHAHKLSLKHPASGCQLVFETAIPPDLSA